jgi:hypothetical protein
MGVTQQVALSHLLSRMHSGVFNNFSGDRIAIITYSIAFNVVGFIGVKSNLV